MKSILARKSALFLGCAIGLVESSANSLTAADASTTAKPVLLYSRYFNASGENRYAADTTYKEVMARLKQEFDVRVNDQPLTAAALAGVNVVFIANPNDQANLTNPPPHHLSAADIAALTRFVEQGGGLIVSGNQENHNLETTEFNKLFANFGMQFTNLYTDTKLLVLPKETPLIGGLRFAYYSGDLVLLTPNHPAKPRSLINNDRQQKLLTGTREQDGCLLGVAEPGKGHVVLVTDGGWLINDAFNSVAINGVTIKDHDNWEIFRRLVHWAAGGK